MNEDAVRAALQALALPALVTSAVGWRDRRLNLPSPAWGLGVLLAWLQVGAMGMLATGTLYPASVLGWLVLGVAALDRLGRPYAPPPGAAPPPASASTRASIVAWFGVCLLSFALLAMAAVPPWYRDEMVYHLALPQQFVAAHAYTHPDDNIFASFPLGWESIVAAAMALGVENPRELGAWVTIADALAIAGIAGQLGATALGRATAAGVFLLIPTVWEFGPSAYVEPWLILVMLLGISAVIRVASSTPNGAPAGSARGGLVAWEVGIWAGFAASAKYPGLVIAAALVLALPRGRLRALVPAVLIGAPCYIRNVLERGNPVFPLAFGVFGGSGWDATRAWAYGVTLDDYGQGRSLLDYVLLVPRLFLTRDLNTGFQGSIGPVLALGAYALARAAWPRVTVLLPHFVSTRDELRDEHRHAGLASALVIGAIGWTVWWALTVQQVRFWLPAAAILAVGVGLFASRPVCALPIWIGAFAWGWLPDGMLWNRQETTAWWAGDVSRETLRDHLLPESAPVYRDIPTLVPEGETVWLVWMRDFTWDFPRPFREDSVFEGWRLETALDADKLPTDVDFLLVNERFFLTGTNADWDATHTLVVGRTERLRATWAEWHDHGDITEIKRWGKVVLYAIHPRPGPG